jgi:hypothetical protein
MRQFRFFSERDKDGRFLPRSAGTAAAAELTQKVEVAVHAGAADSEPAHVRQTSDWPPHGKERIIPSGTIEPVINLHENEFRIYDPRAIVALQANPMLAC